MEESNLIYEPDYETFSEKIDFIIDLITDKISEMNNMADSSNLDIKNKDESSSISTIKSIKSKVDNNSTGKRSYTTSNINNLDELNNIDITRLINDIPYQIDIIDDERITLDSLYYIIDLIDLKESELLIGHSINFHDINEKVTDLLDFITQKIVQLETIEELEPVKISMYPVYYIDRESNTFLRKQYII